MNAPVPPLRKNVVIVLLWCPVLPPTFTGRVTVIAISVLRVYLQMPVSILQSVDASPFDFAGGLDLL